MNNISLKNISKAYSEKPLFENISLTLSKKDRVAVIGENGTGKSTLLKIVSGIEDSDSGSITSGNISVSYIAQEFVGHESMSILDYLDYMKTSSSVFKILKQFSVLSEEDIFKLNISDLSGGQKRVLEISSVLSKSPMIICIDEPENHLDIKSREVLSAILKDYWGSVLFVSHDRYLIDRVSNKILEIENQSATIVSDKTYDDFMSERNNKIVKRIDRWKDESKSIVKLEGAVRLLRRKAGVNSDMSTTYQMKKRELERRKEELGFKPEVDRSSPQIKSDLVDQKNGKLVFNMKELSFQYGDESILLKDVNLDMRFGNKVILLGRNGSGKSTLLKILKGELKPNTGKVKMGNDIKIGYLDQLNNLDPEVSPLKLLQDNGEEETKARSTLAGLLFTRKESETSIAKLSGGQLSRLRISLMFNSRPDFVVLDEPTNNLDPTSLDLLIELINNYNGSVLIISHDRSFLEKVKSTSTWTLKNKTIKETWSDLGSVINSL